MPIYEYACANCGNQFELLQKVSDEPATDCPYCSEPEVKKLVSATSFRLKGSGWYETDFKDKSSDKKSSLNTPSPKKEDKSKTIKPAKKVETKKAE